MEVIVNNNEDLGDLELRDLEFFGIEQEPTSLILNGNPLQGSWQYNSTTMRVQVVLDPVIDMNENMMLKLEGIWWN